LLGQSVVQDSTEKGKHNDMIFHPTVGGPPPPQHVQGV